MLLHDGIGHLSCVDHSFLGYDIVAMYGLLLSLSSVYLSIDLPTSTCVVRKCIIVLIIWYLHGCNACMLPVFPCCFHIFQLYLHNQDDG